MILRFIEGIIVGLVSGIILNVFNKYGDIKMIKSLFQTFVIELWPLWIGLICAVIYWAIRYILDLKKHFREFIIKTVTDDVLEIIKGVKE